MGALEQCQYQQVFTNIYTKDTIHGMLLDDIDSDLFEFKWHKHNAGYMQTGGGNKKRYAHRIVLERKIGRPLRPGELCDHINRLKHDNRRENLRLADKSINSINREKRPNTTTNFVGVYLYYPKSWKENGWNKRYKYVIQRKGMKTINSRLYETPEEADAERRLKLATLNIL